jgi:hypothetical protein
LLKGYASLPYRFSFALYQTREKCMRRPAGSRQIDLFNTPTSTPLCAAQAVRAELVGLLCALLLEVLPPRQSQPITLEEEAS